jgi:hypothetical protein
LEKTALIGYLVMTILTVESMTSHISHVIQKSEIIKNDNFAFCGFNGVEGGIFMEKNEKRKFTLYT